jgi:hypothetical protein
MGLSENPNITWDIVAENLDKPWNWVSLSRHPNITWEIVQQHPQCPWHWYGLTINPNITWDIIAANRDDPWLWNYISMDPRLTSWNTVREHSDFPWNWHTLSFLEMDKQEAFVPFLRVQLQRWFSRSFLKEELMAKVWHPRNSHKFKYLDPDTFAVEGEEEEEEETECV